VRWLKRFLTSDDPIVKLNSALSEPDAHMRKELLENDGVPAMVRNTTGDSAAYGATLVFGFDLYVRSSDAERAKEILGPIMDGDAAAEAPSDTNGHSDGYIR